MQRSKAPKGERCQQSLGKRCPTTDATRPAVLRVAAQASRSVPISSELDHANAGSAYLTAGPGDGTRVEKGELGDSGHPGLQCDA